MVKKLKDDEREFLLSKYSALGYSEKESESKINKLMKMMVVSAATIISSTL